MSTPTKETEISVKMVAPKRGMNAEPPITCSICERPTNIYVIQVRAKIDLDICYRCCSDISDATMYDTYCLKDTEGDDVPAPARLSMCCPDCEGKRRE